MIEKMFIDEVKGNNAVNSVLYNVCRENDEKKSGQNVYYWLSSHLGFMGPFSFFLYASLYCKHEKQFKTF